MSPLQMLLFVAVLPALLCAAGLVAAWRPWRGDDGSPSDGRRGGAVGFGVGLAPAMYAAGAWSGLPPHTTWHWIGPVAAAATLVGAADPVSRLPAAARWAIRMALAAGAAWVLVGAWADRPWLWRPVAMAAMLLTPIAVDSSARRSRSPSIAIAAGVAAGAGAGLLVTLYELRMGLVAGGVGACAGAAAGLAFWRRRVTLAGGAAVVLGTVLPGLMISGYCYAQSDLPRWTYLLLLAAPFGLLVDRVPGLQRRPAAAFVARLAGVGLPAAVGLAVAAAAVAGEAPLPY